MVELLLKEEKVLKNEVSSMLHNDEMYTIIYLERDGWKETFDSTFQNTFPLILAVIEGNVTLVKLLLKHNFDVNGFDKAHSVSYSHPLLLSLLFNYALTTVSCLITFHFRLERAFSFDICNASEKL
jgi:hypothetical protein